ncbi:MerR family transcriptional regulator [bacterium]|nr:MerR family transcriptional regulator [bacterium]
MNSLNNVQFQFSIKNLENLSGIKAHTIRIWEKRYGLLSPDRTGTNIRTYDTNDLQKLLNIALLYNKGYKISKIAELSEKELITKVRDEIAKSDSNDHYLSSLKLAMLNYDQTLFEHTYTRLVAERSFREIFLEVLIPLLEEVGLLWQTDSITPAHEHFLSNLIKQKLHLNIERVQRQNPEHTDRVFVLFLPSNEIHELGLLYLHFELTLRGYQTIYLGQSVPRVSLRSLIKIHPEITYVSFFTVKPEPDAIEEYLEDFRRKLLNESNNELWLLGRGTEPIQGKEMHPRIVLFNKIEELLNKV